MSERSAAPIKGNAAYSECCYTFEKPLLMVTIMTQVNPIDCIFLLVFGFSMLLGFMRGFIREVISVLTYVAATVVATLYSGKLAASFSGTASGASNGFLMAGGGDMVGQSTSMLSVGGSYIALFLGTMLAGSMVNYLVSGVTGYGGINFTNRLLGAAFGAIRGGLITIVLIFLLGLTPITQQAAWVSSQTVKVFAPAIVYIGEIAAPSISGLKSKANQASQLLSNKLQDISSTFSN